MNRISRIRRWRSVPAGLAQNCWQPPPIPSSANWAEGSPSADMCSAAGWLSFRRIIDIPFDSCLSALESWQRTGQDGGGLHLGEGLLRGPIERDRDPDTCRIQVRLPRRPLRPPLLMRLDIDRLSSSRTALELIPCKRARPTAGYFRAGHRLLDSLIHALPVCAQDASRTTFSEVAPSRCRAAAGRAGSTTARLTAGCYQSGSTSRRVAAETRSLINWLSSHSAVPRGPLGPCTFPGAVAANGAAACSEA